MARKTHTDIARDACQHMAVRMMEFYMQSMELMKPTANPANLSKIIDSGVKVICFLEPRTNKPAMEDGRATDPAALAKAFGALLAHQADGDDALPPETDNGQ